MPSLDPVDWRDHYTQLCREGEAAGLTFHALGDYIGQRMTDAELRAMLAEWAPALEANQQHKGGSNEHHHNQDHRLGVPDGE